MTEQTLSINGTAFDKARETFDKGLAALVMTMLKRDVPTGNITLKCDIQLEKKGVTDETTGEWRPAIQPKIKIKVTTGISEKGSLKDEADNSMLELKQTMEGNIVLAATPNAQLEIEEN